ncbi:MAG: TlpA disulfide reductase family protein [Thermoanaerobaculia bacterium]|nr:TlpA disulfide reductase family protein [Thermoanaerobaculia bacterium]
MNPRRLVPLAALALLLVAPGCAQEGETEEARNLVPEFRLPSLSGGELGPADFPGKAVLVEFWATWCTPCRAQAKILEKMWETENRDKVQYLAISVGEKEATVRSFVERNPFSYPVLLDSEDELSVALSIFALPTVMVVDPTGEIVYFQQGLSPAAPLKSAIELATSGAVPAASS